MGCRNDPPARGGTARPVPRSDRAARDQRSVIQRDCRCRRCPHRYRDVASGTCTVAAPQGMDGRGGSAHMTCAEAEILLHALLDDELDAGHAFEVEAHLATCP